MSRLPFGVGVWWLKVNACACVHKVSACPRRHVTVHYVLNESVIAREFLSCRSCVRVIRLKSTYNPNKEKKLLESCSGWTTSQPVTVRKHLSASRLQQTNLGKRSPVFVP